MTPTDKKQEMPFRVSQTFNEKMQCWEVLAQIGGIESKAKAIEFARVLAEFIAGETNSTERVQ